LLTKRAGLQSFLVYLTVVASSFTSVPRLVPKPFTGTPKELCFNQPKELCFNQPKELCFNQKKRGLCNSPNPEP